MVIPLEMLPLRVLPTKETVCFPASSIYRFYAMIQTTSTKTSAVTTLYSNNSYLTSLPYTVIIVT